LAAMHGTIIVFYGILPIAFAEFGNLVMPLKEGATMAMPRLNIISLILFYLSTICLLMSLPAPEGGMWIISMVFNIAAWLLSCVIFIATIFQLCKGGMAGTRLPFFVWSLFLTAFLLFVALTFLEAAALMQLADNIKGMGISISEVPPDSGGDVGPRLWHHLFWFMGHPEVYVLILLILGLAAESARLVLVKVSKR
jgi:cytochrome c oxidase subunit 1